MVERIQKSLDVNKEDKEEFPMLAMIASKATKLGIKFQMRNMSVMKRGLCTFVQKAKNVAQSSVFSGLVVNKDDELLDMPAGKEDTSNCSSLMMHSRVSDAGMLQVATATSQVELLSVLSPTAPDLSDRCEDIRGLAEDIIDRWQHSIPPISTDEILSPGATVPDLVRSMKDEGGRVAVSGENGWAFFDYHLAHFGPQEVPLGAQKLVMANPPFGCDPAQYETRISGAFVAILRGGGCSFGIKVLSAQQLGAIGVIIVNTDDRKTMRLMAQADEIKQITIPTIMMSRRLQYYLELKLKFFTGLQSHMANIQPTGIFGEYEKRSTVALPMRNDD